MKVKLIAVITLTLLVTTVTPSLARENCSESTHSYESCIACCHSSTNLWSRVFCADSCETKFYGEAQGGMCFAANGSWVPCDEDLNPDPHCDPPGSCPWT